ncbi:HMW2B, OMP-85 required for HMW1A and HMW2A secretion [Haemophilus influenzae biotype aegyptius]|uniref:ShlB/FhaC/HecB family hemolysin secretion/activation protein n=1 Tax=Haemophilus influenzae TaxID=727 RepID=UPI0001F367ED|nr:ShlB/FhaC/HecB family hemolysin secretion/activation protein [Haemophilus influenzae]QEQ60902.1 ShlB/FhaC/HecB family hemolysin secretion/activation protein [Haemophilus influenzae biotype aegyptius]QEQ61327.1 ShlB/FhaC/HecB family hemolysin secretion/activation protein [Haemophilus influenzae biotype aegyptius]QEQ63080.1 ShlB/FhaC/HecB family hemolysin secretion/activation protein [Haemophilus influenzae biotype aegyptius]QEQ63605.1 ShlB/FhaC/HecB family hemolysin secretion/activation prote
MNKMNKFKLSAVVLLLGFGMTSMANAEQQFPVNSFQLLGDIQGLTDNEQISLAEILERYQGNQTLTSLKKAQKALQEKLNAFNKGKYEIVLPEQRVENGNVFFLLSYNAPTTGEVFYKGSEGYDEKNIAQSLPSLKQRKYFEDGRQWFDPREFAMAKENPLKITRVHYELASQNKVSNLTVSGFSPYGKTRNFISVDNYGSREFNRARITFWHMNANLTGNDDVLTINALTNFKAPSKSSALGIGYSRPFYNNHQMISIQAGVSRLDSSDTDGLPSAINRKLSRGKSTFIGLNWSYFLPQFDWGIEDQFKLNAGYSYRYYDQKSGVNNLGDTRKNFSLGGINLGISGEVKLNPAATINVEFTDYYYAYNLPGSNHSRRLGQNYHSGYNLLVSRLGYNQDFADGWNFNSQLSGQYTRQDLNSIDHFVVSGIYGVRGFKYSGVNAERGLIWRNELTMPKYTQYHISPYAFYDLGQYRYNKENAKIYDANTHTVSSAGLGVKAELVKNLNMDLFVVRRLVNSDKDILNGNKAFESDKTTFWGKITYSF